MATPLRLGVRLRAARKGAGFKTAKAFLKKHKVPASTYSQHESGSRTPDEAGLKFYARVFNVNLNWLKTGKGEAFKKTTLFKKETLAEESIELRRANAINKIVLEKILAKMIKPHVEKLSSKSIRLIAQKTAEAYNKQR